MARPKPSDDERLGAILTNELTKNETVTVKSLDEITHTRVTSIKTFHSCPARWRAEILGMGTKSKSKYADMGTAVHYVIEKCLLHQLELFTREWEESMLWLESVGVPPKERIALLRYITQFVLPYRPHLIDVEATMELPLVSGAPPIRGHIDCRFEGADNSVIIRDHKTSRRFDGVDHWRNQFQPLLYALGTAKQFPNRDIVFEIGYVNFGELVRWRITPQEMAVYETYLTSRYADMHAEIVVYKRTGQWPERINDNCNYCPLRNECSALVWSHQDFMRSFDRNVGDISLGERLEWAKAVQSTVNHKVDELKEALIEEIKANDGQGIYVGGKLYSLKKAKRRQVTWPVLWGKLWEVTQTLPADQQTDMWNRIMERLNDMVSVKVTSLSEFLLAYPAYSEPVNAIIESVESETLSLQIKDTPLVPK